MFPGNMRGWEILALVALVVLLFGAKRLPDAARGLGRSLRIFKSETKGLVDENAESGEQSPEKTTSAPPSLESGDSATTVGTEPNAGVDPVEPADRPRSNG
jgi:sec-independent protein translocase protein TatA